MKSRPTCKAELFAGRTTGISTYRRIAVGYRNSNANTGQNKMKTISKLIYVAVSVVSLAIGAVTVNGALNDLLVSINGTGANGEGLIYEYTPTGVQSIFASGLSEPRGMVFDRFGNLFVANTTFDEPSQTVQASIVKIARPDKAKQWLPPNDAGRERGKFF